MADVTIGLEGTLVTFTPETDEARRFFREEVCSEGWQWLGPTLAVDHRLASDLVEAAEEAGLTFAPRPGMEIIS